MRNILVKIVVENKTRLISDNFFPENFAVYEIMWKSIVETDRAQMTIWRMRLACWIPRDTDTHSEYVLRIAVYERASVLSFYVLWLSCKSSTCHLYDCSNCYIFVFLFTQARDYFIFAF